MSSRLLLAAILTWASVAWAQADATDPAPEVTLSAENQARMGVTVAMLEPQTRPDVVPAYVRAVDIVPLLALAADSEVARASAEASEAELARISTLAAQEQGASARDVEAARSAASADRSRLDLLRRRLRVEWSADLAHRVVQSPDLLEQLSRGDLVLLRADAPDRPDGLSGEVSVNLGTGAAPLPAEPVGRSGTVDPQMQTVGLYALARPEGQAIIRPGRLFDGEIRTSEVSHGYLLPRSAVVRVGESVWVYVRTGSTTFERRALSAARPEPDGWFAWKGFDPADRVAVTGAESLLAVERAAESPETD